MPTTLVTLEYTTLAALKRVVGSGVEQKGDDPDLLTLIYEASEMVREWCDRDFTPGTASTQPLDAPYSDLLFLPDLSDTTLPSLTIGPTYTALVAGTDYRLLPLPLSPVAPVYVAAQRLAGGVPVLWSAAPKLAARTLLGDVHITGTWGWPGVPRLVERATRRVAARLYHQRKAQDGDLAGGNEFTGRTPVPDAALDDTARQWLAALVHPRKRAIKGAA